MLTPERRTLPVTLHFALSGLAACAPGLSDRDAWRTWFSTRQPPPSADLPALLEVPAGLRRRVAGVGRAALHVAGTCRREADGGPVIFASRHGELARGVAALQVLARSEPLSPAAFALSVHNALAGIFSIAQNDTAPYTTVSAGSETVEAAFVEACGLLSDGEQDVLIVVYEESLPDLYEQHSDDDFFPRAFACRLHPARSGPAYRLDCDAVAAPARTAAGPPCAEDVLPDDLEVLRFLVSDAERLERVVGRKRWLWSRSG